MPRVQAVAICDQLRGEGPIRSRTLTRSGAGGFGTLRDRAWDRALRVQARGRCRAASYIPSLFANIRGHLLPTDHLNRVGRSANRFQLRITLGAISSSRLSSATAFSPATIRWTVARLNSVVNTRRPSAFRRCSPTGPPAASYVPTVSSRNGGALHRDGAFAHERDWHRMGTHAVAGGAGRSVGGVDES